MFCSENSKGPTSLGQPVMTMVTNPRDNVASAEND